MAVLDIVGIAEIAELTGIKRNTLVVWYGRGHLPEADAQLSCGLIWRRRKIERWLAGAGRERVARAQEWLS